MFLLIILFFSLRLSAQPNHLDVLEDSPEQREQKAYDMNNGDGLEDADFTVILNLPPSSKEMRPGERERDELNKVIYMTQVQRENYELRARQGLLFRKDGITPFDTKRFYGEGSLLFVISREKRIYAARGVSLKVHHSSLLAGDDVLAAGKIVSQNGKILRLSDNSGHYKPDARHLLQAIFYFHQLGVLSPDATILLRNEGAFSLKEGIARLGVLLPDLGLEKTVEP